MLESGYFQEFIARSTRELLSIIANNADHREYICGLFWDRGEVLRLDDADWDETSILFPDPPDVIVSEWLVFSLSSSNPTSRIQVYELRSTLSVTEPTEAFVALAHHALLLKPADPDGQMVFTRLIENGQMTRRDLLVMFARSSDAKAIGTRVLIIPSPSPWLPDLEATGSETLQLTVRTVG